ncbi:MAG: site-specific integrase [Candidatus Marinimicrobia bacterium]|nr:site-specific integrase [Candidatus Neomarinimicrobiota bacterium]
MASPRVNLRKIQRKSGYVYQIDYTVNGKRFREVVSTRRRDAELIASKKETDLALGRHELLLKRKSIGLSSAIDEYIRSLKNIVQDQTIKRYNDHLEPFKKFMIEHFPSSANDIRSIKAHYIKECVDSLLSEGNGKKWAPYTVNRMLQVISSVFIYCKKRNFIEENPVSDVKKIPVPEKDGPAFYSEEELELIWNNVNAFWKDHLQFIYYTGVRLGEMINLTWDKVDLEKKPPEIRISASSEWRTKTGKSRLIPLHRKAIKILEKWTGRHPKYVFTSQEGNLIHPSKPYNAMKRALKKAGLVGHVHKLRTTFASHLVMKGANVYEIQKLLGHVKIQQSLEYMNLSPKHKKNVIDKLD